MAKETHLDNIVEAQKQYWESLKEVRHVPIYRSQWVCCPMPNKSLVGITGYSINDKKDFEQCCKCNYYGGIFIAEGAVICKFPALTAEIVENAS